MTVRGNQTVKINKYVKTVIYVKIVELLQNEYQFSSPTTRILEQYILSSLRSNISLGGHLNDTVYSRPAL